VLLRADAARIRQAMLAVLDNARRYAPNASVRVETCIAQDRGLIRCADTGPGLPADAYGRVFEPFWGADGSRARASGGSGLGLSVVRAIANAYHGDAIVRPGETGGVTVEISLPLTVAAPSS
jgi:two-component system sensor histidine kinase AdeS